jgi:IS5 family transposase
LSLVVSGANVPDTVRLTEVLDNKVLDGPDWPKQKPLLCADKGYDSAKNRAAASEHGYTPHIRSRKEEAVDKRKRRRPARRWVVEAAHSWFNRFRKVLVRYEKKVCNYRALLHIVCAAIAFRFAAKGGKRDGAILG